MAFARKLDPVRGEKFVELTGATIRGVGRGVVGISALQSVLAGLGFVAAGLSQASLLACAVLIFGIVQIGAAFVIIPVIVWTWTFMDTAPAIVFTVYMVMVNSIDNVLKPFLMGTRTGSSHPSDLDRRDRWRFGFWNWRCVFGTRRGHRYLDVVPGVDR